RPQAWLLGAELLEAREFVVEHQCIDMPRTERDLQPMLVQDFVIARLAPVEKLASRIPLEGRLVGIDPARAGEALRKFRCWDVVDLLVLVLGTFILAIF